jgi:hypothetical protein
MQLRPIRVERPDQELPPKRSEFAKRAALPFSAFRGVWKEICDGCHDAARLFSLAAQAAQEALPGAENEFSPDLLKQGFNCHHPTGGGSLVIIRGERMENATGAVALWGARRYISDSKSP